MNKIIDLHTHLNTLGDLFLLRTKIQNHLSSPSEHIRKDHQVILSVAMYSQFYEGYTHLVEMIKRFKLEVDQIDEAILISNKSDLSKEFKLGIILHIESARTIDNINDQLEEISSLGVRGIIPIHFKDNLIGTSCDDPIRRIAPNLHDKGLSDFGYDFVEKCNELKIWLDLTHTTDLTADQILIKANKVMVSHIGIRDLVNRRRNKTIRFYKKLAQKNGIIGITPWRHLIGQNKTSYIETVRFGIQNGLGESLCIGTDFGAPISSHESLKSIFDIGEQIDQLKEHSNNIKFENALRFFQSSL